MQIGVHAVTIATINPLINNIAQRIASGSGGDISLITQILQQIATQVRDTAGEASAIQTINRTASEVNINSESAVSLSLVLLQSHDTSTVKKVIQDIAQQISEGATVPEIIARVVIPAMLGMQNANQLITQTAQNVISGNTENSGQIVQSSLVVCPPNQQYFNQISEGCILDQASISYTDNKCKSIGIADTIAMAWDGNNIPTYAIVDSIHTLRLGEGSIGSLIQTNFNIQNIICIADNNWRYKEYEVQNNNFVIPVSTHGITLGQVERVIQQIILKIALQGGKPSAQQALIQIAEQIADNPKGSLSQSIFKFSQKQSSGNQAAVSQAINEVAEEVSQGADPAQTLVSLANRVLAAETSIIKQTIQNIAEQIYVENGGDPAQINKVIQNLALATSIKGGNTQEVINNIATKVEPPDDSVSTSLSFLAIQQEKGNYDAVNRAVEKVAEGVVAGNDVEQSVTTAAAITGGTAGESRAAAPLDGGITGGGADTTTVLATDAEEGLDTGVTGDDEEEEIEALAAEEEEIVEDDEQITEDEEEGAADEEEVEASDELDDDAGDDDTSGGDEGDDSSDDSSDNGGGDGDGGDGGGDGDGGDGGGDGDGGDGGGDEG
jgi:hypothetical protein